jgi:hypothetical protein
MNREPDELCTDTQDQYLVLASGACPKVLAPDTIHIAQFRVWDFDTDQISKGVHPCMSVYAGTNDLPRYDERNDDDPRTLRRRAKGQSFACSRNYSSETIQVKKTRSR